MYRNYSIRTTEVNVTMFIYSCREIDVDTALTERGHKLYVNQKEVEKVSKEKREVVSDAPQGPSRYEVSYNDVDPLSSTVDNWNWGRTQPCKRAGFCLGGKAYTADLQRVF